MDRRDDYQHFEGRAERELNLAKLAPTCTARANHRKFAKCYRTFARQLKLEERRVNADTSDTFNARA